MDIRVPLFADERTSPAELEEGIRMDAMAYGMGCCCLQITFQARDLPESRYLYDQLAVLCPIFLALSAGCPILKGLLADTDVRWDVIAQSVDCRTPVELGASKPPANGEHPPAPPNSMLKMFGHGVGYTGAPTKNPTLNSGVRGYGHWHPTLNFGGWGGLVIGILR